MIKWPVQTLRRRKMIRCEACGYEAVDDVDLLAHLTECPAEPEEHWSVYTQIFESGSQPFKNSEILEEGK